MTAGRVGRVTTARFQRVMHARPRAGYWFGVECGAVPSCTLSLRPTARWGFGFAVAAIALLGIVSERAGSLGSGFSDSLLVSAGGLSGVFRLVAFRDLSVSQISFPRVRGVGKDDETLKWRGKQGMI
jgi:hypothetical protein